MASPITLTDVHGPFTASVQGFSASGQPIALPAGVVPVWSLDSANILTSTPSADGSTDALALTKNDGSTVLSVAVVIGGTTLTDSASVTVTPTVASVQIQFSGV